VATEPNLETKLTASARAWRETLGGNDMDPESSAERKFADCLEQWIAGLLTTDERWTQEGRWYDGLVFLDCIAKENDEFETRGSIWEIRTQDTYPFRATLRLAPVGLASYDIRFGDERPNDDPRQRGPRDWEFLQSEPEWRFRFERGDSEGDGRPAGGNAPPG